jgi:hypothetical protein
MDDVRSLLSKAVPQDLHAASHWPDTESDLARGRTLLVRRRRRFALMGGASLIAVGTAGALLLTGTTGTGQRTQIVAGSPTSGSSQNSGSTQISVALVAYKTAQPKGYTLETIPQGWEVASADNVALVLHKIGTPKGGDFTDKILIEGDLNPFPKTGDQAVKVNGAKGWYIRSSNSLIFQTDQHGLVDTTPGKASATNPKLTETPLNVLVQLPQSLNWDVMTMTTFASGITVSTGAGGAVG